MADEKTPLAGSRYQDDEKSLTDALVRYLGPEAQAKAMEVAIPLIEGLQERQARLAQQLGQESARTAFGYEMFGRIPDTISQSFGNQAMLNVLGARGINDAYNQAVKSYPTPQFPSMSYQPQKYFS
jgi:hypothetical protein